MVQGTVVAGVSTKGSRSITGILQTEPKSQLQTVAELQQQFARVSEKFDHVEINIEAPGVK